MTLRVRFQDDVRTVDAYENPASSTIEHQSTSQNQQVDGGSDSIFPHSSASSTTTHPMSHHFYHQPRTDSRMFGSKRRQIKMGWAIFLNLKKKVNLMVNLFLLK